MSEPIIEQIAVWLKDALSDITRANGYQQDLDVRRPEDLWLDKESIHDGTTIIVQSHAEGNRSTSHQHWDQIFESHTYFIPEKNASLSMDTRINRVAADIQKRIGVELENPTGGRFINGLARDIFFLDAFIYEDAKKQADVLQLEIVVDYQTSATNSYST